MTDLVGTPTELVNLHGGIAWFHRTTLWGVTTDQARTGAYTPLRFQGQYADPETGFNYNFQRYYDTATGNYASCDPLGLAAGPHHHRYVSNPLELVDPLGLNSQRACKRAQKVIDNADNGVVREAPNYHGRLPRQVEQQILANPDAVYVSQGTGGRLIFRGGDDVVITEGSGARAGQVVTSYGPSGPRGESGATIFGGEASDPGMPITHQAIVEGKVPRPDGGYLAPATQILPRSDS